MTDPNGTFTWYGHSCIELRTPGAKTIIFDPIEKLAPKADAFFRINVHTLEPGTVRFKISVTSTNLTEPVIKIEKSSPISMKILPPGMRTVMAGSHSPSEAETLEAISQVIRYAELLFRRT